MSSRGLRVRGLTLVRKLRRAGAGSRQVIGIAVLLALFEPCAIGSLALAQAGSTGGTLGKTDKSVAGGDEARRQQPARSAVRHREPARASSCSRLIGVWRGALGGDITYRPGGTVLGTVPANEGTWSCGSNGVSVTWTKIPSADHCTLSSNGMLQNCTNNSGNSFTRSRKS
jgi:hypothetical protein